MRRISFERSFRELSTMPALEETDQQRCCWLHSSRRLFAAAPRKRNADRGQDYNDTDGWLQIPARAVNRVREIVRIWLCSAVIIPFVLTPLLAEAQPAGKVHRIGFLGSSTPTLEANLVGPFRHSSQNCSLVTWT
jgi:hypothetical protein